MISTCCAEKIIEVGNVVMVQIDPLSSYLGVKKMDSFRTTDVRAVLAPVVALAAEMGVTILGVPHFNKKMDVTNVLLRISDSLAFGATARHVYAIVNDADHERKLMVKGKNNLAPARQQALAYKFAEKIVAQDPANDEAITAKQLGCPGCSITKQRPSSIVRAWLRLATKYLTLLDKSDGLASNRPGTHGRHTSSAALAHIRTCPVFYARHFPKLGPRFSVMTARWCCPDS
jgi:hypothetical protein